MKKYNKIVATLAVIFTVLYAIAIVGFIVLTAIKPQIYWLSLVIFTISGGLGLILLWALNNALERIEILENVLNKKGVVERKDIEEEICSSAVKSDSVKSEKNIIFCEDCGYPISSEDEICPNCGAEVNAIKENDEL